MVPTGIECHYPGDELRPHYYDCTKFLQCANNIEFEKQCQYNLRFNPLLSVCDWPYNVPEYLCPNGTTPGTPTTSTTFTSHSTPITQLTSPSPPMTATILTTSSETSSTSTTTTQITITSPTTPKTSSTPSTPPTTTHPLPRCQYTGQLLPNLNDPTNKTYIVCDHCLPACQEEVLTCPSWPSDLFFDENRNQCWERCIKDEEGICEINPCHPGRWPCQGIERFKDLDNCFHFWTCDQDKFLTEWHLCRGKCEMVSQIQKAFNPDLYNGYCEFPIKNGTCNFRHEHLIYD